MISAWEVALIETLYLIVTSYFIATGGKVRGAILMIGFIATDSAWLWFLFTHDLVRP